MDASLNWLSVTLALHLRLNRRGSPNCFHGGLRRCYNLIFPLTVSFADGTTATASSFDELSELVREWLTNNPDPDQAPSILFPFEVELDNGTMVTINNIRELGALLVRCVANNARRHYRRNHRGRSTCYELMRIL